MEDFGGMKFSSKQCFDYIKYYKYCLEMNFQLKYRKKKNISDSFLILTLLKLITLNLNV